MKGFRLGVAIPLLYVTMLAAVTVSPASGQSKKSSPTERPSQTVSEDRLAELEKRVKSLETSVKSLETRMTLMSNRVADALVVLDCATHRYVELQFEPSHMIFLVSCQAIEPYLEGHQITLNVGNPYSFNFRGLTGQLYYGKTVLEAFEKKVEVSTTETIRSGTWQTLKVIVNPSKAEDMRSLALELSATIAAGAVR